MDNYAHRPIKQHHSSRNSDSYQEEYTTSPNSAKHLALDSYQTSTSGLDSYQSSGISDSKSQNFSVKTDSLSNGDSELILRGDIRRTSFESNHVNQEELQHNSFHHREPNQSSYNVSNKESLESYYSNASDPVYVPESYSRHPEQHSDTNMKLMNRYRHCYRDMDHYSHDMRTGHEMGPYHDTSPHDKSPSHDMSYSNHSVNEMDGTRRRNGDWHHFRSRDKFSHPKTFGGRYNQNPKNHVPRFERFKHGNRNPSHRYSHQNGRPGYFGEKNTPGFGNDSSKVKQNKKTVEKFQRLEDDHTPVFGTNFSLNQDEKIPPSETRGNIRPYFKGKNRQLQRPAFRARFQQTRDPYYVESKNLSAQYVHRNDEQLPAIVDEIVRRQNNVGLFHGYPQTGDYAPGSNNKNCLEAQSLCEIKTDCYETSPNSHVRNGEIAAKKESNGNRLDEYQTSAKSD